LGLAGGAFRAPRPLLFVNRESVSPTSAAEGPQRPRMAAPPGAANDEK